MTDQFNPNKYSDSAGQPWEGRQFGETPFRDDDGSAPAELARALADFRNGLIGPEGVVNLIGSTRLLIPLVANLGDSEIGIHGKVVDKSADLSIVTVATPDNQKALPVFSSVAAMSNWNSSARPVPVDGRRAALAAAAEGNTRIVLDPGSVDEFAIRRPAIAAIAKQQEWMPPQQDEQIQALVAESLSEEKSVRGHRLTAADPAHRLAAPELRIELVLADGLSNAELELLLHRVSTRWAESSLFTELVDSVELKITSEITR